MNIYDIVFLGIVALFLVFGLFGKLLKQLIHLIMIGISIPVAYFVSGMLMGTSLPTTLFELIQKIEIVKTLMEASDSLSSFLNGSMRIVVFYVTGIVSMIVFSIIGLIIFAIVKNNKFAEKKGVLLLGLLKALSAAVVLVFITSPVPVLHTAINEATVYMEENKPESKVTTTLSQVNGYIKTSKVVEIEVKALDSGKVPFLNYEAKTSEESTKKTYNFYSDMEDLGNMIPSALELKDLVSGFNTSIDLNNKESIIELLDKIGDVLGKVDEMRDGFKEDGAFKGIVGELVKYFIEEYPQDKDSLSFLRNAKNYLTSYNYESDSYKDKLPMVIIQSYIDSLESSNNFAKYITVTDMNFDTLKSEIAYLPELMKTLQNMSEIDSQTLKNTFTGSLISKQVVSGLLDDYYTDDSINESNLDYDKECDAITSALHYSNDDDDAMRQAAALSDLVDKLVESDLLPAIIYSYETAGTPFEISVSADQKLIVEGLLDTKLASGDITSQQYNTYKNIFKVS